MRLYRATGPVTIKDLEDCLNILAETINMAGDQAELLFPLWARGEREIAKLQETERIRSAVKERYERNRSEKADHDSVKDRDNNQDRGSRKMSRQSG